MSIFAELSPPYSTIVADPPWQSRSNGAAFGTAGVGTGRNRAPIDARPESRYSTLDLDGICALPVADLAAKNAHAYVWATCSGLDDGIAVLRAWGFTYKTTITWVKNSHGLGLGAYFRTQTEHVIFGVRGSLPTLVMDQPNVFEAARTGHSRKPAAFLDLVERSSPGPYVELFCRDPRFGWDSWGFGYEGAA